MGWLKRLRGGVAPSAPSFMTGTATAPGALEYFEVPVEGSFFLCSDKECPCPGTAHLALGDTGYLCVNPEVIEMRKDALTSAQLERKVAAMRHRVDAMAGGSSTLVFDTGTVYPIIMCKQGAERRGLDLRVAAADAKHWASTGLVPLRETPRRDSKKQVTAGASSQAAPRYAAVDEIAHEGSGSTKLHLACSHGDVEQVRQLLAQGANVNITNKSGATALDLTYSNGDDVRYRPIYAEIATLLRARGGKTNKWKGAQF